MDANAAPRRPDCRRRGQRDGRQGRHAPGCVAAADSRRVGARPKPDRCSQSPALVRVRAHMARRVAARGWSPGRGAAAWRRGQRAHLLEAAEAFSVDGRLVHEDLLAAVVGRDEAEALLRVEPLDLRAGPSHQTACNGSRRAAGRVERQCSPNWTAKTRPQRQGRRRLPTPSRGRAQLVPAERRLPPRDAWRARRGSRRGGTTRGPCSGDHGPPAQTASRQPRAPCPASWRQPSSLAGLVATPAWSADLNQVVRFFATSPRPPRAPCALAGSMAAPESMLDVPDSASFSFPAEARPAAAETLGRAAARRADARRAAGGAHPGVLGRDQGV
jgi:hypothetical protein